MKLRHKKEIFKILLLILPYDILTESILLSYLAQVSKKTIGKQVVQRILVLCPPFQFYVGK